MLFRSEGAASIVVVTDEPEKYNDVALADGVKRVTRLINQMRFLARDSMVGAEPIPMSPLIEEAYQEAYARALDLLDRGVPRRVDGLTGIAAVLWIDDPRPF